ncbi:unnamed protein product [Caenorhabditis nigoni]
MSSALWKDMTSKEIEDLMIKGTAEEFKPYEDLRDQLSKHFESAKKVKDSVIGKGFGNMEPFEDIRDRMSKILGKPFAPLSLPKSLWKSDATGGSDDFFKNVGTHQSSSSSVSSKTSSSSSSLNSSKSSSSSSSSNSSNSSNSSTSSTNSSYNQFKPIKNCTQTTEGQSFCEVTVTWNFKNKTDCFHATYLKKIVASGIEDPLNGVEQCTKTPCDTTEKLQIDCKTAFGDMYSKISVVNNFPAVA